MTQTTYPTKATGRSSGPPSPLHVLGKRRRFLVHKGTQLRAVTLAVAATLILLVVLNLSLHSTRHRATQVILSDSPELGALLHAQDRTEMTLVLTASIVFLLGVFAVTVLETHKTAGAALNITRSLRNVQRGSYGKRVVLRKGDNLRDVERAFNDMTQALEARAWEDAEAFEKMAAAAETLSGVDEARELARLLRAEADRKRGFQSATAVSGQSAVLVQLDGADVADRPSAGPAQRP